MRNKAEKNMRQSILDSCTKDFFDKHGRLPDEKDHNEMQERFDIKKAQIATMVDDLIENERSMA